MKISGEVLDCVIKKGNPYGLRAWPSFDKDIRILIDQNLLDRYASKIRLDTSLNFKFILSGDNTHDLYSHYRKEKKKGKIEKNLVVILFSSNEGSNSYPFTPWILFHRSFHAIFRLVFSNKHREIKYQINRIHSNLSYLDKIISEFRIGNTNIQNILYDFKEWDNEIVYQNLEWGKDFKIPKFNHYVFNFRSARLTSRLINLDIFSELFAQMFVCGKIKLADVNIIPDELISKENKILLKEKYLEVEEELNKSYTRIIQNLGGNVYAF